MARLADPSLIDRVTFPGACECPGTPHVHDEVTIRTQLGGSAMNRIGAQSIRSTAELDPLAVHRQVLLETALSWNLVWRDPSVDPPDEGEPDERPVVPVPLNELTVRELDGDALRALVREIDGRIRRTAPKASGGRRRRSSSPTASPTRQPSRKRTT
jgi:hypothetical protein